MPKYSLGTIMRVGVYRLQRLLFGRRHYVPFIILSRSRTGSNLLNSFLSSHPNVKVKGEHFGWLKGRSIERRARDVFGKHPPHIRAAGCKVFYYHPHDGDHDALMEKLRAVPGLRIVHLQRRETVRSVLSWFIARETNQYVARRDEEVVVSGDKRVRVDADEFVDWIRKTRGWERGAPAMFPDRAMMDIYYEDVVADPPAQFRRVLDFLDLPPHEPKTHLRRQNPEPVRDLIENYAEVEAKVKAAGFGDLLDDQPTAAVRSA
jgi:LPS sulfotransferase NodH